LKNRFRQIREYFGLSQAEFAQKIHMSPGFISNVETGRSRVSARTLNAVCGVFPISRDWLMEGEGEMLLPEQETYAVDKTGVGGRIKEIRKRAGLTQDEFARRIGYSKIQVLSAEKGKIVPSNQFLEKIVSEFKLNPNWMFTGTGPIDLQEQCVDQQLIDWLNDHPEIIKELRRRGGLD